MRAILFVILLFLNSSLWSQEQQCVDLDLNDLWDKNKDRKQGDVGSCHSFGTVALLEAYYKIKTNQYIDLSERDLFEQHLSSISSFLSFTTTGLINQEEKNIGEAGLDALDFIRVKNNGICTEVHHPYEYHNQTSEQFKKLEEYKQMYIDGQYDVYEFYKSWKEYSAEISIRNEACIKERIIYKDFFSDFKFITSPVIRSPHKKIMESLRAGFPVLVLISDYESVYFENKVELGSGFHYVVISGYDCKLDAYLIRNSRNTRYYDSVKTKDLEANMYSITLIK